MSEYPDHLNPFYKGKGKSKLGRTLSKSFREFKGFLLHRSSFREKPKISQSHVDKNDHVPSSNGVELRKTQNFHTLNRNNVLSLPTSSHIVSSSPALPRSRFKERLSRSSLSNNNYDERCNPFADKNEVELNPFEEPPVPHRRRKSKKRAPLPPEAAHSNPNVNLECASRSSSWSLTSSECTDYDNVDYDNRSDDSNSHSNFKQYLNRFNRDMDLLNKTDQIEAGELDDKKEVNNNEASLKNAEDSGVDIIEDGTTNKKIITGEDAVAVLNDEMKAVKISVNSVANEQVEMKIPGPEDSGIDIEDDKIDSGPIKIEKGDLLVKDEEKTAKTLSSDELNITEIKLKSTKDSGDIDYKNDQINGNIEIVKKDSVKDKEKTVENSNCDELKTLQTKLGNDAEIDKFEYIDDENVV